jgi:3-deoxy-manno-octulosonate cytidylyltransferase (CMP-KDO synthetase)
MNLPACIIPSRLESSRIFQKPLIDICGIPMIVHVFKRAELSSAVSDVFVATDSEEIAFIVKKYGGKAILTSTDHRNGTERMIEAIKNVNGDTFVQIMGDEPLLNPTHIRDSVLTFNSSEDADLSLLVSEFKKENSPGDFKVVINHKDEVMYISRGDIPCSAKNRVDYRLKAYHITTISRDALEKYMTMEKSPMEKIEDHEYLRFIENGHKIITKKVENLSVSVDYPEDLSFVRKQMAEDKIFELYRGQLIK